ncbi:MAG: ABC transporter ATP-binding protein [Candidatus Berkelbacteria bacterium]|nr:ABC transporter ATP-binding protein [Candidatus Berkelbacteria bacterium]
MQPIIKIEKLSKKYRLGAREPYYSLRDKISELFKFKGHGRGKTKEFWALKDINLAVKQGEALGIIGRNGAGKSTLLKILSQITPPTKGKITMRGRVASLLEVGTGFHPELTGRENIYLNGAILGMSRREINRKFDEIVAFSEIEKFLDTPVKRYSSGMYVRLAFAVAAHLEPEILLVDEVLAVGDTQFQKKCLGKMSEVGKEGRTVLFVSHNMAAIAELCQSCVMLNKGKIVKVGESKKVISVYLANQYKSLTGSVDLTRPMLRRNSLENSLFKWTQIQVINSRGERTSSLEFAEPFEIIISGRATKAIRGLSAGFGVTSALGFPLFNSHVIDAELPSDYPAGKIIFKAKLNPNLLGPGVYNVDVGAVGEGVADWIPEAIRVNVEQVASKAGKAIRSNYDGIVVHPCEWSVQLKR